MAKYTVKAFAATGKSDPKFGAEFKVFFNEDAREVTMSRKSPVVEGQEENGEIVSGKYGAYFKKDPFVPGAVTSTLAATAPQQNASPLLESTYVPYKKTDNSDGMRKGMAINNAAAYVLASAQAVLPPETWAKTVADYARALYQVAELEEVVNPDDPESVDMKETLTALGY